jgi:hypothetical protein
LEVEKYKLADGFQFVILSYQLGKNIQTAVLCGHSSPKLHPPSITLERRVTHGKIDNGKEMNPTMEKSCFICLA